MEYLCVAILLNDISNLKAITLLHASRSGTPISTALKEYYNLEVHIDKLLTYNQAKVLLPPLHEFAQAFAVVMYLLHS